MATTQIDLSVQAKAGSLTATEIASGTITDTQISATAAVAFSKLAALSSGQALIGNAGVPTATTLSGDVTLSAAGVLTIGAAVVTGSKIAAATVADSNLATAYIKADGTRAWTGNQDLGGFLLTGLGAPVNSTDVARKGYVDGVAQGLSVKDSVRVVSVANQGTLSGLLTIDGVTLLAGDRVLLVGQTTATQNGIYVAASGAWARSSDMATGSSASGSFTFVEEGTTYASTGWVCNDPAGSGVVDTDSLGFTQFSRAGVISAGTGLTQSGNTIALTIPVTVADGGTGATALTAYGALVMNSAGTAATSLVGTVVGQAMRWSGTTWLSAQLSLGDLNGVTMTATEANNVGQFATRESFAGDGATTAFTLANAGIISGSESVYLNGLLQESGAGNDYTIASNTITFATAPGSGAVILVSYRYH